MNENRRTNHSPPAAKWNAVRDLFTALLILAALGVANPSMAQMGPEVPLQFKIIGKFYSPGKEAQTGVNAFEVNILKKTKILDVVSSHTLEGTMLGSTVLQKIYPPIMTFVGPEALLAPLTNPDNEGKTYTLTGQLYVKKRLFQIREVQGPGEEQEGQAGTAPEPGAEP